MQATYSDIVKTTGVSKPTVIKVADELDPDKSHRTVENRTTIMDDWLTQAVADKLTKKGLVKQVASATEGEVGEESPVLQNPGHCAAAYGPRSEGRSREERDAP